MKRFKSGDIIRSTIDTPLQRIQVFDDYGIPLEYLPDHKPLYNQVGDRVGLLDIHWTRESHWVLDEVSEVQKLLNEYDI
jgi:hypothetical protein